MRLHAAGRITSADRGQWNGVRVERAGVENARRQSERNHSMREHGSHGQQSELRRLALLSDPMRIAFRNPDAYHLPVWQGDGRESRECGANPRGMEERCHGIMGYRQFRRPAGWLASIDYDEVGVQWA